jgi:hypothetical protein
LRRAIAGGPLRFEVREPKLDSSQSLQNQPSQAGAAEPGVARPLLMGFAREEESRVAFDLPKLGIAMRIVDAAPRIHAQLPYFLQRGRIVPTGSRGREDLCQAYVLRASVIGLAEWGSHSGSIGLCASPLRCTN